MMKKISFLMLFALSFLVLSCRTEEFHNEEVNQTISQPRLTSKRISLNEAKHKARLLTEIDKSETALKSLSKTNIQGKVISYNNGVLIDTDEVLYIENGPNYHTYTFNLVRENALPTDPVENLVLSPLSDGTYKELLVSYNLSVQEKEILKSGGFVNTKGKTQVMELAQGTFNTNNQLARQVCTTSSYSYWEACSGKQHHDGSNYESCPIYQGKEEGTPPIFYTIITTTCLEQNEMIITPIDPPNNGGGSGGESPGGTTTQCSTPSIPTNPQPGFTDENGCPIAIPTQPYAVKSFNLIVRALPAEVKALLNSNTQFYNGLQTYYNANPTQQGENFVKWAAQVSWENQNVTWAEFQNWFINNYDNAYRDKLALLTPSEMQNFIDINREIDASLYEEEFVKETNEAFVAFASFADIETMSDAQMQSVLSSCCPSIIVVPQALTLEKSRLIAANYQFNRKYYPEWSKAKCFWEASRETIQLLLDLGGLVPVIGEVCDLTNATIYALNGDGVNASLSAAGAIPFAGWFTTGSKLGVKVVNNVASDIGSRQVLKWVVGNDGLIKFGYSSQLRKVLKLTDATKQAHHIIPWAYNVQIHSVVQKAAKSSNAFHLNEALNGIAVASWRNQPNHNMYNNRIFNKLEQFRQANPNATPDQCYNKVLEIINQAKQAIINNPNSHLNDLVF